MSDFHKALFARRDPVSDSEYSDSVDSIDSGNLAHIPIANLDIKLGTMSFEESQLQTPSVENVLTSLITQINTLNQNIPQTSAKQESYETTLQRLTNPENTFLPSTYCYGFDRILG